MGIELDVLVGHPEHELLFVAYQVAAASGLKHPKQAISDFRNLKGQGQPGMPLSLVREKLTRLPVDQNGRALRITTILFSEPEVYKMLLRGHAPQSEPFRRWVTEEVLPTIRKTGQYNAAESSDPIALGIMSVARSYVDSTSLAGV